MSLSARDTLSKQSLTRLSLVNTYQKTNGETANHNETAGIRTLQGEGGHFLCLLLSTLRDLDCSEQRVPCPSAIHWVVPTGFHQRVLLQSILYSPQGDRKGIPELWLLRWSSKKNPVLSECALKPEASGRFSVELEEGCATPETQGIYDGSLLPPIPFPFLSMSWRGDPGTGVYLCLDTFACELLKGGDICQ